VPAIVSGDTNVPAAVSGGTNVIEAARSNSVPGERYLMKFVVSPTLAMDLQSFEVKYSRQHKVDHYFGDGHQKMNMQRWLAGAAVLCFAGSAPAHAGTIRSPVAVVGNTLGTAGGSTGHLIDQSGLSVGFISGQTDFETYINLAPTHAVVSASTGWASSANTMPGYLEFDLGSDYSISTFAMWTQNTFLAVNSFTLSSALDAGFTSGVTALGSFNAVIGLGAQTFSVSGRRIRSITDQLGTWWDQRQSR
jgi:hypothetical protein